jgi:hypothetical protein
MKDYTEVIATLRIPNEKIKNLIITAIEVGSNYWASLKLPVNWKEKYDSVEEIPFKGGEIEVYDCETDELLGVFNLATVQTGLQLMANFEDMKGRKVPERHFKNILEDNWDAETADVFLQLSVMTEIVFG